MAWLSQTTLSVDETNETVAALRERFPMLLDPPSDDICYATQNRQAAVKQIAAESDVIIVVGSRNSSNSVRLVEVALDAGARAAYLVDDVSGIDPAWLEDVETVGVTSGASVPEDLVSGVVGWLADRGSTPSRKSRQSRSGWCSRCRTSCGRPRATSPPSVTGHGCRVAGSTARAVAAQSRPQVADALRQPAHHRDTQAETAPLNSHGATAASVRNVPSSTVMPSCGPSARCGEQRRDELGQRRPAAAPPRRQQGVAAAVVGARPGP